MTEPYDYDTHWRTEPSHTVAFWADPVPTYGIQDMLRLSMVADRDGRDYLRIETAYRSAVTDDGKQVASADSLPLPETHDEWRLAADLSIKDAAALRALLGDMLSGRELEPGLTIVLGSADKALTDQGTSRLGAGPGG